MSDLALQRKTEAGWTDVEAILVDVSDETLEGPQAPDIFNLIVGAFAKHWFSTVPVNRAEWRVMVRRLALRTAMDRQAQLSPHVLIEMPTLEEDGNALNTGHFSGVPIMLADEYEEQAA